MKLKGKRARTNRTIDCRSTGGPFIPDGATCTIKIVRRDKGYRVSAEDT